MPIYHGKKPSLILDFKPNFGAHIAGDSCAAISGAEQARRGPEAGGAHEGHKVHQGRDQDDVQGIQTGKKSLIGITYYKLQDLFGLNVVPIFNLEVLF